MRKSNHGLHASLGQLKIDLVFRHQWEEETDHNWWNKRQWTLERRLGIWWKTYRTVGSTKGLPKWLWKDTHSPNLMIGVEVIWFKFWIGLGWGTLILNTNRKKNEDN
jgi:hypothetical protein